MYIYTYDMDPYQPSDHWRVWGSSGPVLLQQEMEMAEKAQRGYRWGTSNEKPRDVYGLKVS